MRADETLILSLAKDDKLTMRATEAYC